MAVPPQVLCDVSSFSSLFNKFAAHWLACLSRAIMLRCIESVPPLSCLLKGGRKLRSWLQRIFKRRRGPRGGPLGVPFGGPPGAPTSQRVAAAVQHIISSLDAPELALLLLKNVAAAAANFGFEGLCLSERALRGVHTLLYLLDRAYTPGSCPPYPSATFRSRSSRGSDVLLLLHQQQPSSSRSSRHRRHGSTQGSRRMLQRPSTSRASGDEVSSAEGSYSWGSTNQQGGSEWAVVHLGAEGFYEPEGVAAGIGDAYRCLSRGFTSAKRVCLRLYTPNPRRIEAVQVAGRLLPAIFLRPLLGFTEGCTRVVQGARNQLRPSARAEWLAGARRPRFDVGQICADEDDDMLVA